MLEAITFLWKIMQLKKEKKTVQVKAISVCLKGANVQRALFYWNEKSHNVDIKNKVQETK